MNNNNSNNKCISSTLAFKVLMFIPEEIDTSSSSSMKFAEIDHLIKTFSLQVLQCVNIGLNTSNPTAVTYAIDAMQKWR